MSDIAIIEDDALDEYLESPEFEQAYEDLWQRAKSAAGHHIDELGLRDRIPSPEGALAKAIIGMQGKIPVQAQGWAFDHAVSIAEEDIRRAEVELAEMRRALAALQRPRSELLRSSISLVKV